MKKRRQTLSLIGILFLFLFAMTGTCFADSADIDLTVPSELHIIMNADGTNTISEYRIENNSLVNVTMSDSNITAMGPWSLVAWGSDIGTNTKELAMKMDGNQLLAGENSLGTPIEIPASSFKIIDIDVQRGLWTESIADQGTLFTFEKVFEIGTSEFTITFVENGGKEDVEDINATNGATVTLPSMTHDDLMFTGWKAEDGTIYAAGNIVMPAKNLVLTAQYEAWPEPILAEGSTWYRGSTPKSNITEIEVVTNYEKTGNEDEVWDASAERDGSVMAYVNDGKLTIAGNGKIAQAGAAAGYILHPSLEYEEDNSLGMPLSILTTDTPSYEEILGSTLITYVNGEITNQTTFKSEDIYTEAGMETYGVGPIVITHDNYMGLANGVYMNPDVFSGFDSETESYYVWLLNKEISRGPILTVDTDTPVIAELDGLYQISEEFIPIETLIGCELAMIVDPSLGIENVSEIIGQSSNFVLSVQTPFLYGLLNSDSSPFFMFVDDNEMGIPKGIYCANDPAEMGGMMTFYINGPVTEGYGSPHAGVYANTNSNSAFSGFTNATTIDFTELDTSKVSSMTDAFCDFVRVEEISFGEQFAFVGNDGYLPEPSDSYIDDADGKWYSKSDGSGYLPADIPENKKDTYVSSALVTAIVYSDGYMVFQKENIPDPNHGEVVNSYLNPIAVPTWYIDGTYESITHVEFLTTVKPTMTSMWFAMPNLIDITGLELLDTSLVTAMDYMFYSCNLTSLDLSSFNTQNVTDMSYMFDDCSSLTSLDLSNFNTQNVTNMDLMFHSCSSLTSLDFSSFNTQNVTDMNHMFYGCSSLTSLDLSNFNTQNVTDMHWMFAYCDNLTSLDLSNFNTQNVTDMHFMFYGCSSLTSLDLSSFNTQNVTNMNSMFSRCYDLTSLDLSNFNTQNVTDMHWMFGVCSSLTSLDLSSFNTQNVTDMSAMFRDCSNLQMIFASESFDTTNLSSYNNVFQGCTSLLTLSGSFDPNDKPTVCTKENYYGQLIKNKFDVSSNQDGSVIAKLEPYIDNEGNIKFELVYVGNGGEMSIWNYNDENRLYQTEFFYTSRITHASFAGTVISNKSADPVSFQASAPFNRLNHLISVDITGYDVNTPSGLCALFSGCSSLEEIIGLDQLETAKCESLYSTFYNCTNLQDISGIENWDTSSIADMIGTFSQSGINSLDLSRWDTSNVQSMESAFKYCTSLTNVDLSNFNNEVLTNMDSMFSGCNNLSNLNLSNFKTQNVSSMYQTFYDCNNLSSLDLSSFNTQNVTSMYNTFQDCNKLTTIYASDTFVVTSVENGWNMFVDCFSLVGGNGTTYSEDYKDELYARIDTPETPGYFTDKNQVISSVGLETAPTKTTYYDGETIDLAGMTIRVNYTNGNSRVLSHVALGITDPVVQENQVKAIATFTDQDGTVYQIPFDITSVYGLQIKTMPTVTTYNEGENFDPTGMDITFRGESLESSEYTITNGDTIKANQDEITITYLHEASEKLYSVEIPITVTNADHIWDVSADANQEKKVTAYAFENNVTGKLDIVIKSYGGTMKYWASDATSDFHASSIKSNVGSISFTGDVKASADSSYAFYGFSAMTSFDGTNLDTSNTTNMSYMFANCTNITTLDVSDFNTEKVTDVSNMFNGCEVLTELDISSFSNVSVATYQGMFNLCYKLTTIYISGLWDETLVPNNIVMFATCSKLIGQNGTSFTSITSQEGDPYPAGLSNYAKLDRNGTPGYFSEIKPVLAEGITWYRGKTPKASITEIETVSYYNVTGEEDEVWDASERKDGSVMAYVNGTKLTIAGNGISKNTVIRINEFTEGKPITVANAEGNFKINTTEIPSLNEAFGSTVNIYDNGALVKSYQLDMYEDGDSSGILVSDNGYGFITEYGLIRVVTEGYFNSNGYYEPAGVYTAITDPSNLFENGLELEWIIDNTPVGKNEIVTIDRDTPVLADINGMYRISDQVPSIDVLEAETKLSARVGDTVMEVSLIGGQETDFVYMYGMEEDENFIPYFTVITQEIVDEDVTIIPGIYTLINPAEIEEELTYSWSASSIMKDRTHYHGVYANENSSNAFAAFINVTTLNLEEFNTGDVTNMQNMFASMTKLEEVNLGEDFEFVGTNGYLPDSTIEQADGLWYSVTDGTPYAANEIPANTKDTYSAVPVATAILYSDGYFVMQHGSLLDPEHGDAEQIYLHFDKEEHAPWLYNLPYSEIQNVKTVSIQDEIKPKTTALWFMECRNLTSIENLHLLDTSDVTDMSRMFFEGGAFDDPECLAHLNTENATNMSQMFVGTPISALDLSTWDVSKVVNMEGMFSDSALETLNVSNWNTSNVMNMNNMFFTCLRLKTIDLSGWSTESVTDMGAMFEKTGFLEYVTLGKDFKFINNEVININEGYLVIADGKWYDMSTKIGYTPEELSALVRTGDVTYTSIPFYTVTLDGNGCNESIETSLVEQYGKPVTLPAVTKADVEFIGWETSEGAIYPAGELIMPKGGLTLTAKFDSITGITITTPPDKTTYYEGELFDPTGMVVTATFSNDSTRVINEYSYTPNGSLNTSDTEVTITYTENGKEWSATQQITVKERPALTFASANPFTIATYNSAKNWDGTLYYSTDGASWTEWDGTSAIASVTIEGEQRLYLRGSGNTVITGDSTNYRWVLTGSDIRCNGNIETLLDYETVENGDHPTMATYCYANIFRGCTGLTTAPELPATNLADSCYRTMFQGCTGLTTAPELPATSLAEYCYSYMFDGCTSLTTAPELPATTLAEYCYSYMFRSCTGLTTAPELPATSLANYCYQYMFRDCTSLTTAPELPATSLAEYCYYYMFQGCTGLTAAPELPATSLANYCYSYMFDGCTGLITAPELPATTLANYCYYYMFDGCTGLTTAPELPATTLASNCYYYMFDGCTSLTTAPVLPATTLAEHCYSYMFRGCTGLTTVPELPATTLADYCYRNMFYGCTGLKFSETKTDEYVNEYRIPMTGTGTTAFNAMDNMFRSTGGTFTGTPTINTTYYTSNTIVRATPQTLQLNFLGGVVSSTSQTEQYDASGVK